MNDHQKECAAKELCRLRGIDPDKRVSHGAKVPRGGGFVPSILLYSAAWELALEEIEEQEIMERAMAHGRLQA